MRKREARFSFLSLSLSVSSLLYDGRLFQIKHCIDIGVRLTGILEKKQKGSWTLFQWCVSQKDV